MELEATVKEMNWDLIIMNGKMTMRWKILMLQKHQEQTDVLWYALLQMKWALWYKFCKKSIMRNCCHAVVLKFWVIFRKLGRWGQHLSCSCHVEDMCTEWVFKRGWGTKKRRKECCQKEADDALTFRWMPKMSRGRRRKPRRPTSWTSTILLFRYWH